MDENEEKSLNSHTEVARNRNRNQLTEDQMSDVTLDEVRRGASEKAPQDIDGYFIQNVI